MQYDRWQWHKDFLTCTLLEPWHHGWFGRSVHPLLPHDLHRKIYTRGKAHFLTQVHGTEILNAETISTEEAIGDGLFTAVPGDSVWVCSADCVPLLMGDLRSGMVMAVHAGWRGTAKGILAQALAIFRQQNDDLTNLRIGLGPAISGLNYQVGKDVAQQVLQIVAQPVGITDDPAPDRCRLDLRAVQKQFFLEQGLRSDQVSIAPYCTYADSEYFFSYRRGDMKKVQWAGIYANIKVGLPLLV